MKDLVISGTGNSRFLKSIENFLTQYPTYQSFAAAMEAGTFPIDFNGLNELGIDTMGTPLNKSTLLTDAAATRLGLNPETATVDDAIKKIFVPQLTVTAPAGSAISVTDGTTTLTGTGGTVTFYLPNYGTWTVTISKDGQTNSGTVVVDQVKPYSIILSYFTAYIHVKYLEGATCTCANGSTTLTAPDTTGEYTFSIPNAGDWVVSVVNGEKTYTRTVTVSAQTTYNAEIAVRYGYKVNISEPDPAGRVEYLFAAVGKTPAAMDFGAGEFGYGDWEDFFVVANNFPCMVKADGTMDYKLSRANQNYKADGTTASDVANSAYNGNAMTAIPKMYVYRYTSGGYRYCIFCEDQFDDNYKAYAHTNADGTIGDYFYYPMFKGSLVSNKLRSIAGRTPQASTTAAQEIAYATAMGAAWQLRDWGRDEYIADVLCLLGKSTNSQAVFGQGHTEGGSSGSPNFCSTGSLRDKGQFFGYNTTGSQVKVLFMEGFWGDRWDRILGLMFNSSTFRVKMTPEGNGYNTDGTGYTNTSLGVTGTSGNYISTTTQNEYGCFPAALSGSEATYECDGCWFAAGTMMALRGGNDLYGAKCGSRSLIVSYAASYSSWTFGASLSLKNAS